VGVYYLQDTSNQRFIVSFIEVPYSGTSNYLTFQVILNVNGEVDFNYGRMDSGFLPWGDWWNVQYSSPATIGIENADGSDGLEIAYQENYLHDSLSIKIYPSWLALASASGHIMPGSSETATISFRAGNLAPGIYTGTVYLETNDPNTPSVTIPVSMEVQPTGIEESDNLPIEFSLSQNYPNPFNAQTTIQYSLPEKSMVTIDIYDILGRKIETLAEGIEPAGNHQAIWDAIGQSSGIYFYRIKAGDKVETKRMVLMK
jgi:hypothetical protein